MKKYHAAGVKVLVSAFGSTENPTTSGYDAATVCDNLADFVITNHFDGVDLDYEDNGAFEKGTAPAWIVTCVQTLRKKLPVD